MSVSGLGHSFHYQVVYFPVSCLLFLHASLLSLSLLGHKLVFLSLQPLHFRLVPRAKILLEPIVICQKTKKTRSERLVLDAKNISGYNACSVLFYKKVRLYERKRTDNAECWRDNFETASYMFRGPGHATCGGEWPHTRVASRIGCAVPAVGSFARAAPTKHTATKKIGDFS